MNSTIKREDLEYLLDCYEAGILSDIKMNPSRNDLDGKLQAVRDIRHRVRVLSLGGLKVIT